MQSVAAPVLTLIGLLLAFSFSLAGDRFALRRAAAVQEANSIGTFWLRTSLVPEPTGRELRARVRRYVDLHLEHRSARIDEARTAELEAEAGRLQQELWTLVVEDAERDPEARRGLLVVPALNAMFDDTASALAARENRLPDGVYAYLFSLALVAGLVVGYQLGGVKRDWLSWAIFALVVSGVLVVLLDMDRPRRGWIQTDTAPYMRLLQSMHDG